MSIRSSTASHLSPSLLIINKQHSGGQKDATNIRASLLKRPLNTASPSSVSKKKILFFLSVCFNRWIFNFSFLSRHHLKRNSLSLDPHCFCAWEVTLLYWGKAPCYGCKLHVPEWVIPLTKGIGYRVQGLGFRDAELTSIIGT
jgi:hypothetical protein